MPTHIGAGAVIIPSMSKRMEKALIAALTPVARLDEWPCPHFPTCGGCVLQDRAYADQVAVKRTALLELWGALLPPALHDAFTVTPSPDPFGYRLRMDYVCSDDRMGLRQRKRFFAVLDVQECHLIPPATFDLVRAVYNETRRLGIPDYNVYHGTGFLRYLVLRRNVRDEWLLAFVTSAHTHNAELEAAAQFALAQGATSVWWLHNPHQSDTSFGAPLAFWGAEHLPQYVADATLAVGPNTFFQNNIGGFEQILQFAQPHLAGATRLVDAYAGVGTIGIVLGREVERVVAMELVEESVGLLHHNLRLNGLDERTEVLAGDVAVLLRDFAWQPGDVAVLDPPRAGLMPPVCKLLNERGPQRIVYISCNAVTQLQDLALLPNYRITAARGFDLFPQTFHSEQVVVLERGAGD